MKHTALDILQREPERIETEDGHESPDITALEDELAKPSRGECIALWLEEYSEAFREKVAEIRSRYNAGEWDACAKTAEEPPRTSPAAPRPPLIAPAPVWEEAEARDGGADLYAEGSYLYALYPPIEELQGRADELETIEIAEAIDTFLDHATEREKLDFNRLERESIRIWRDGT